MQVWVFTSLYFNYLFFFIYIFIILFNLLTNPYSGTQFWKQALNENAVKEANACYLFNSLVLYFLNEK